MLRQTLMLAHQALDNGMVDHALIGGLALATLGINRATSDVDLLCPGDKLDIIKNTLSNVGFTLRTETSEVLHFGGVGYLDILLANRPVSLQMLADAQILSPLNIKCLGPEDIIGLKIQAYINNKRREFQDKADISSLIEKYPNMDWQKIKKYADVFNQWHVILAIKESSGEM